MNVKLPDRFEDSLGYLVHHLLYAFRQGIVRRFAVAGFPVTHEELGVLVLLMRDDGLTQTHLAETLAKDKAVITRLLDGLVKKHWVERRPGVTDRRLVRAFLTPEGTHVARSVFPLLMDYVSEALNGVSQEELDITFTALRRIIGNLKQMNEEIA